MRSEESEELNVRFDLSDESFVFPMRWHKHWQCYCTAGPPHSSNGTAPVHEISKQDCNEYECIIFLQLSY